MNDWIAAWLFGLVYTGFAVGWIFLVLAVVVHPFSDILALGVPLGLLFTIGCVMLHD